jgi:hypothetical protein
MQFMHIHTHSDSIVCDMYLATPYIKIDTIHTNAHHIHTRKTGLKFPEWGISGLVQSHSLWPSWTEEKSCRGESESGMLSSRDSADWMCSVLSWRCVSLEAGSPGPRRAIQRG